tara:strand:- start:86 stop:823 length:738 start_codon:yes stop_codon:yes gene_type:complete
VLTAGEIGDFQQNGFLTFRHDNPHPLQLPELEVVRSLLAGPSPAKDPAVDRHLDDPLTYAICKQAAIVERVAALLGPDLLLWHTRYFNRVAGGSQVPWHQDAPFWAIEPRHCVSAWIALEDVHEGNGCVYVVPGSNHVQLAQLPSEGTGRFHHKADIDGVDISGAIPLVLRRGEFFLFDAWLLHRSGGNPQTRSRIALAVNYITPDVLVDLERPRRRNQSYGVQLVRGRDTLGLNPHAPAPGGAV